MSKVIIIEESESGLEYSAHLEDEPGFSYWGDSSDEVIGILVRNHLKTLGITLKYRTVQDA